MDRAIARLREITVNPAAGRSERDAMPPEFIGLDSRLFLPIRRVLVRLVDCRAIRIERIELADRQPTHPRVQRIVDMRWRAQNSPARRAVCAALAHLEHEGIDLMTVRIGDTPLGDGLPIHVVGWTVERLNLLPDWIHTEQGQWLQVVNPSRGKPMTALRFIDPVAERLPERTSRLLQ